MMETGFRFWTDIFKPTRAEADEEDPEINPGIFAREFADFIVEKLKARGIDVRFRVVEDWGHWIELEHQGAFSLALCCSSVDGFGWRENLDDLGDIEHALYLQPRKPFVSKWFFKKIHVEQDVSRISKIVWEILQAEPAFKDIYVEERDQQSIDPPEDIRMRRYSDDRDDG